MGKSIRLSIVVPVYNESKRIAGFDKAFEYLKSQPFEYEVIFVDDGSSDNTLNVLKNFSKKNKIKIISYSQNQGKGFAIKEGMLAASGDFVLFMDVDLSTPIEEIGHFLPLINKHDILIGTRKSKSAKVLVPQPLIRKWLGRGFTLLSQLMLNVWVSDFTCGFKLFSNKSAKKIFKNIKIYRWGFDSEVLYLAKKYKFSVGEVPVTWVNDTNTKVKFPRDLIISFKELFAIRFNDLLRLYE